MSFDHQRLKKNGKNIGKKIKHLKQVKIKVKRKFYALDMFPYPSGAGLHVGHPEGYTATDILCTYETNARL